MSFFARITQISIAQAEAAAKTLGIPSLDGLSEEMIRHAFRQGVRAAHPDTAEYSSSLRGQAAREVMDLQGARDVLIRWLEALPADNCPTCRGTGYVRGSAFGTRRCPRCR
jgi:DnaJ-class molecular chaperone